MVKHLYQYVFEDIVFSYISNDTIVNNVILVKTSFKT